MAKAAYLGIPEAERPVASGMAEFPLRQGMEDSDGKIAADAHVVVCGAEIVPLQSTAPVASMTRLLS